MIEEELDGYFVRGSDGSYIQLDSASGYYPGFVDQPFGLLRAERFISIAEAQKNGRLALQGYDPPEGFQIVRAIKASFEVVGIVEQEQLVREELMEKAKRTFSPEELAILLQQDTTDE